MQPVRRFLQLRVNKLMLGWVVLVLVATSIAAAFLVFVLPYARMPDVSNTPWHELARGVAPGDEGAHQPDDPYFILGTNESQPSATAALKRRLTSQGWKVYQDPNPFGGVTLDRPDDPGRVLSFDSFPSAALHDIEDYAGASDRLAGWQRQYAHIYILEMFFP